MRVKCCHQMINQQSWVGTNSNKGHIEGEVVHKPPKRSTVPDPGLSSWEDILEMLLNLCTPIGSGQGGKKDSVADPGMGGGGGGGGGGEGGQQKSNHLLWQFAFKIFSKREGS